MTGWLTVGFLLAAAAPGPWTSVQTNALAQWKAAHRAPEGVAVDKAKRRVTILAEATGLKKGETVEFFAVGPGSDRAYESLFVTVAEPSRIAAAIEAIGVPRGKTVSAAEARFWPQGEPVALTVDGRGMDAYVTETVAETNGTPVRLLAAPFRFTGGTTGADLMPPCAVFAYYACGQSPLQLDSRLSQAEMYGRFKAARELKAGTLVELTVSWDGVRRTAARTYDVTAVTDIDQLADRARADARGKTLYADLAFADDVSFVRARSAAQAFAAIDGTAVRMNGRPEGQFYYGAFLPDPAWRDRSQRIFQPFEFRPEGAGGRFTFIAEDWSGTGSEPILKPFEKTLKDCSEIPGHIARLPAAAQKISVMFVYLPLSATVGVAAPALKGAESRIGTFYLFEE